MSYLQATHRQILVAPIGDSESFGVLTLGREVKKPLGVVYSIGPTVADVLAGSGIERGSVVMYERDLSTEFRWDGRTLGKGEEGGVLLSVTSVGRLIGCISDNQTVRLEQRTECGRWSMTVDVRKDATTNVRVISTQDAR